MQNADDAGARTVKFCLDLRQHPTGRLHYLVTSLHYKLPPIWSMNFKPSQAFWRESKK